MKRFDNKAMSEGGLVATQLQTFISKGNAGVWVGLTATKNLYIGREELVIYQRTHYRLNNTH